MTISWFMLATNPSQKSDISDLLRETSSNACSRPISERFPGIWRQVLEAAVQETLRSEDIGIITPNFRVTMQTIVYPSDRCTCRNEILAPNYLICLRSYSCAIDGGVQSESLLDTSINLADCQSIIKR